jgi:hypothetical protein
MAGVGGGVGGQPGGDGLGVRDRVAVGDEADEIGTLSGIQLVCASDRPAKTSPSAGSAT